MPYKKGREKTGGRQKGSTNKLSNEAKDIFVQTLGKHSGNIDEAFQELFRQDKTKFLEIFAKYAQFFTAKKTEATDRLDVATDDFDISKLYGKDK